MRYSNLHAFEKHLESSAPHHLLSLYLLAVPDRFMRKKSVERLINIILSGQSYPEMCLKTFEVENASLEAILEETVTRSLFSPLKVIWIDCSEKGDATFLKRLQKGISSLPPKTFVVFSTTAINASSVFYKYVEKEGVILELKEESSGQQAQVLNDWLIKAAMEGGKRISMDTCQLLVSVVGADFATLQQEIDKLCCYIGERAQILPTDVTEMCVGIGSATVWQLGDALFKGETGNALKLSRVLLDNGTVFFALLRQIRNQFQTTLSVGSILTFGGSAQEVMNAFPYMKPGIVDKQARIVQNYGLPRLQQAIILIDETETLAKNSSADHELLLELLIAKLSLRNYLRGLWK